MRTETEILKDLKENGCPEDGEVCTNMIFGCGDCSKPGDLESIRIEEETNLMRFNVLEKVKEGFDG